MPPVMMALRCFTPKVIIEDVTSEQLEFMGDTVLKLLAAIKMLQRFPTWNPGQLSNLRSKLVSNIHLFEVSKESKLIEFIRWIPLNLSNFFTDIPTKRFQVKYPLPF